MRTMQIPCPRFMESWKKATLMINVPTMPIPVQMAYPMPKGMDSRALDSR